MDKEKIEQAVRLFLEGIGENVDREGLVDTPRRISNMCEEIFAGLEDDASKYLSVTFEAQNNEMIIEKDINFYSMCEHHILPFYGKAHVAYIPNGKVVGISKLARTVDVFAKRPQIQEQMTAQIADAIMEELGAKGAMVMIEAKHLCMSMRGIKKQDAQTVTYVTRGEFTSNVDLQDKFFNLVK
ncbi:MAG: GTP cyclohydrolase I FolE [Lachnospiraceae bacterium]|nr:GTP cyclohydrolase I FolE [Lachnospiraceae bacterium]